MLRSKHGRTRSGLSLILLALLAAGCENRATSRQPAAQPTVGQTLASATPATDIGLPPWKGDAAMERRLGSYQTVAGYEIRPPKDYRKKELAEPGPLNVQVHWVGTPRADKSRPQLTVFLLELANTKEKPEHLLQALFIPRGPDTRQTAYESGQIGGLQFQRVGWRGTRSLTGRQGAQVTEKQQGVSYVGRDGKIYIVINFQDSATHNDEYVETAKLMAAAIATFRKK